MTIVFLKMFDIIFSCREGCRKKGDYLKWRGIRPPQETIFEINRCIPDVQLFLVLHLNTIKSFCLMFPLMWVIANKFDLKSSHIRSQTHFF